MPQNTILGKSGNAAQSSSVPLVFKETLEGDLSFFFLFLFFLLIYVVPLVEDYPWPVFLLHPNPLVFRVYMPCILTCKNL